MPKLNGRVPKYRMHKQSGQAIVTLDGRDHYLGLHGSDQSRTLYDRLIAQWLAVGRGSAIPHKEEPVVVTVNEVVVSFWNHAEIHYRKPDGTPTSELDTYRQVIRPLTELYGQTPATEFGPRKLKAVRQRMIDLGWCRSQINKQTSRIKTVFRWAAEEEMVGGDLYHALRSVRGLQRGRTDAAESEPVRPVPVHMIEAVRPYVSCQVWALIRLQLLTGARAGELVLLRPIDIDTTGKVWLAQLDDHKTAHHGHHRSIYFGPMAQAELKKFMTKGRPLTAYLFSPREARGEQLAKLSEQRTTPLSCGNRPGTNRKSNPKRAAGNHYTVDSYRRAIQRACDDAFPPPAKLDRRRVKGRKGKRWETYMEWRQRLGGPQCDQLRRWQHEHRWHPHQLRHNAATRIRKERGIDAARAVLGHRSLGITDTYAELVLEPNILLL
jgi:integrase